MRLKNNVVYFFSVKRFEQQYGEGYDSFYRGVWGSGPYPHNTMKNKEWNRGWNAAYYENLSKVVNG